MSTTSESAGRVNQKSRTRNALIAAARDLLAEQGRSPTVEEVAAAASISRTTAYRYFPNQAALLSAAHPEVDAASLLPPGMNEDPARRLKLAVEAFTALTIETEPQLRTMLRLSLQPSERRADTPLRKGRAIEWFEDALAPLTAELGEDGVHQLAVVIRSATGIESLIWLADIAGLSRAAAAEVMQWSAQGLLAHAIANGPPPSGK